MSETKDEKIIHDLRKGMARSFAKQAQDRISIKLELTADELTKLSLFLKDLWGEEKTEQ